MDVQISERAQQYVVSHGGIVYVRTTHSRCCSGLLTMLRATIDPPVGATSFTSHPTSDVDVRYSWGVGPGPSELMIDLKGRRHPRLEAYWDGCQFRM